MCKDDSTVRYYDPSEQYPFDEPVQRLLDEVNRKIAGQPSLEEMVDYLFEATRPLGPTDRIGTAFLDDDGRRIVAHHTVADYEPLRLKAGYTAVLADSSLRAVIESGRTRVIPDLEAYLEAHPKSASTKLLLREGVRSNMTCPLRADGRIVGVLFRSSREPEAFDERQVAMHHAVAERLAQAVEKTWRIEQLEMANRSYTEMLGFVSHELKSPVALMVSNARLMADGYTGDLTDQQSQIVRRSIATGEYMIGLIREYLDLARIEGGKMHYSPIEGVDFVSDVLDRVVQILEPSIEEKGMRFVREIPDAMPAVSLDPDLFRIVMMNLLGNGVKYGYPKGELRLRLESGDGVLRGFVRNDGPGFESEERSRLFKKFSRLKNPKLMKEKGTGVGLYTTWRIVHMHGGRIDATAEPDQWAEFSFEIPQPPARPE